MQDPLWVRMLADASVALISSDYLSEVFSRLEKLVANLGVTYEPFASMSDFVARSTGAMPFDVVVVPLLTHPFDGSLMDSMPRLRGIVSVIAGVDGIDLSAATQRDIAVLNGHSEANSVGMAEATILLMLASIYNLHGAERLLRENRPRPKLPLARQLKQKTVGLIGFGRIAEQIVQRLEGWDTRILVYTSHGKHRLPPNIEAASLDDLLSLSDVISLHCALNSETEGLLSAEKLGLLKPGAMLINTARGGLVDERALVDAIRSGRISAVALDAFAVEPLAPAHPLRSLDRALLTPHMLGHTRETLEAMPDAAIDNIASLMGGHLSPNLKNPQVKDAWLKKHSNGGRPSQC